MDSSASKLRILEIEPSGDFRTGGTGVILWSWYQQFDLNKLYIDFFCHHKPEDQFIQIITKNGGHCYIRTNYRNIWIRKIRELHDLKKLVKNTHYDCVHIHTPSAATDLFIYLTVRKCVNKVFMHSHMSNTSSKHSHSSNTSLKNFYRIVNALCKLFLLTSRVGYLACSDDAAAWLFSSQITAKKQYTVIENGICTQKFIYSEGIRNKVRGELGLSEQFVIGHVGRFVYQKNHTFLIDVFAEVHKKCPEAVLLLIGGENSPDSLVEATKVKVAALGLSESVIFYGTTDRVNELYQAMDCFVFPSNYEGLGIVAIEAQAAGLKTLCSDQVPREAKITELLEYLSLSDPPEKWADKILTYKNYQRENMQQIIIDAGYDIKQSAKKLEGIYLASRCV